MCEDKFIDIDIHMLREEFSYFGNEDRLPEVRLLTFDNGNKHKVTIYWKEDMWITDSDIAMRFGPFYKSKIVSMRVQNGLNSIEFILEKRR